jgi:UDP-N-acetylmuramoyl-tripeptide--D-alanyl-D-alanine ligase
VLKLFGHETELQGKADRNVIGNVTTTAKKYIKDNTLLFHLDRQPIDGKYYDDNEAIVIVTDTPEQCRRLGKHIVLIRVSNVEDAYWQFVNYYRKLFHIPVIGITGTSGKTTTKEMIKHILRKDYEVRATYRNVNSMSENLRYLLSLDETTQVAVFEMPVAGPRYLSDACRHFQPNIRILLNIGVYHLTDCDTPEEYLKAKAEILEGIHPDKETLILNADDENIKKIDVTHLHKVVYFGFDRRSQFRATNVRYGEGGMHFSLRRNGQSYQVYVPGYGTHSVYNALAALAAVTAAGVDMKKAIRRLASYRPMEQHLEFKAGSNGCTVIDDTWNITPLSMAAALEVLNGVASDKTKIAVLGHMPRLGSGDAAQKEYAKMGEKAVETKVDLLIVVGEEARAIGSRALELGMNRKNVRFCTTGTQVYNVLKPYLNSTSIILLKITHRVMVNSSFVQLRRKLIT